MLEYDRILYRSIQSDTRIACPNMFKNLSKQFQSCCKLRARVREATWHRMSHRMCKSGSEGGFVDVGSGCCRSQRYKRQIQLLPISSNHPTFGVACSASQPKHKARRLRTPFCLGSWTKDCLQKFCTKRLREAIHMDTDVT